MKTHFLLIYKLVRKFTDDAMPIYAASAAFWLIISAVPFLMVVLSALQYVPALGRANVEAILFEALPHMKELQSMLRTVLDHLYVTEPAKLLSLGAVLTVWSASTGVAGLVRGIQNIYGSERKGYVRLRLESMAFTFVFALSLLLSLVLLVLGGAIQQLINRHLPFISALISYLLGFRWILTIGFLFLSFILLYRFLPGKAAYVKKHYPGALLVSVGWVLLSYAFSIYFTHFKDLSYTYGSLGAIILLMLWTYAILCMVFFGAELNAFVSLYELYQAGEFPYNEAVSEDEADYYELAKEHAEETAAEDEEDARTAGEAEKTEAPENAPETADTKTAGAETAGSKATNAKIETIETAED